MWTDLYQVDAFAERPFAGNPAAVCPLEAWPSDAVMQAIAAENNLAETAFFVANGSGHDLRWFTPRIEVDLCGHATLASAHVLFAHRGAGDAPVVFDTRSGPLTVARDGDDLVMDLPARPADPVAPPAALIAAVGGNPQDVRRADRHVLIYASEAEVAALKPDFAAIERCGTSVVATAPGAAVDFVSRYFAPAAGIPEDPVTGSAHAVIAPYWAERLGKSSLRARQISARGGAVGCEVRGDRVILRGRCQTYLVGQILMPEAEPAR